MISNIGIIKLLLDLAKVPLTDTNTLQPKVDRKLYNDPEYLICTLVTEGIYFISLEELKQAKRRYKLDYKWSMNTYKHRSEDMQELIDKQQISKQTINFLN